MVFLQAEAAALGITVGELLRRVIDEYRERIADDPRSRDHEAA
jgi:hypothetical protein